MKILANEYESNIPRSSKISQGGTANFSLVLSDFLTENGHEWLGLIVKILKRRKLELHFDGQTNRKSFWELVIPAQTRRLIRAAKEFSELEQLFEEPIDLTVELLKKERPNLVFLNGTYLNPWIILKAAARLKIPAVTKHAGIWKREIKANHPRYSQERLAILGEIEKDFSRLSAHEIFLNEWSRDVYEKEVFPIDRKKTSIIRLPFSDIAPCPKKKKSDGIFKIGIVARWDKIKNQMAVLKLAKAASEKKLPWAFYSVVSIPSARNNRRFEKDYQKYVRIEPPRDRRKLDQFYQKMDLMILPSHCDVSPHVVPEALFNGTPTLISPNMGWINDYRLAGAEDWIIDFDDPEKVIARIQRLKIKPLPGKLRGRFESHANIEFPLSEYLDIFTKINSRP